MELSGTIKKVGDITTFASGFQKRELVIVTQEQYPQPICIDFLQNNVELLNSYIEGMEVKIGINIRGREWTSPQGDVKYFNSIVGWRIENLSQTEPTQAQPSATAQPTQAQTANPFEEEDDDLPF